MPLKRGLWGTSYRWSDGHLRWSLVLQNTRLIALGCFSAPLNEGTVPKSPGNVCYRDKFLACMTCSSTPLYVCRIHIQIRLLCVQQFQVVTLTTLTAGVTEYLNAQKEPSYGRPQVYDQIMKRKPVSFYHGHHWRNSVDCLKNVFI